MKYRLIIFFLSGIIQTSLALQKFQSIDSLLQAIYPSGQPGAAIAILQHNRVVFTKGYGLSSMDAGKKINANTIFNVGSITKQFTAMAILQLEAAGKLSLDDPLKKYFPNFPARQGNSITLRELLTHSSGLIDHYDFVDLKGVKHATDEDVLQAVERVDSFYFEPGKGYRYSNTAYCLLALIIGQVSGLLYPEYIRTNLFVPLKMNQSFVLDMKKPMSTAATGYEKTEDAQGFKKSGPDESVFFSTQGDGGLYTSLPDYIKWWMALQKPQLFSKGEVNRARSAQYPIDLNRKLSYGFGWFVSEQDSIPSVYHTGSNGGFRAIVYTIPATGYAVIIFSNRTGIDLEDLVKEINNILRINNKSFSKLDSLISFKAAWPIFAPCKKTPLFLTSSKKNWNASDMALNSSRRRILPHSR